MINSGVYTITHVDSGRVYVGSAAHFGTRMSAHRTYLNQKAHQNSYLQRLWNKYGKDAFKFEVVERIEGTEARLDAEQRRINDISPHLRINLRPDARSSKGLKHSAQSRANMKKAAVGRQFSDEARLQAYLHNLGSKASEKTRRKMSEAHSGVERSGEFRLAMSKAAQSRSREHLDKIRLSLSKQWILTSPDGERMIVRNMTEFAKAHNLQPAKLYTVAKGERSHHKGWKAERYEDPSDSQRMPDLDRYNSDESDDDRGLRRFLKSD